MKSKRDPQRGAAMAGALIVLVLMLTLGTGALVQSVLEMKATTHFNTGNQAFFVAESGLLHALNAMNSTGVVDFKKDVADRWTNVYGSTTKTVPGYANLSYEVQVLADVIDPINRGTILATGHAPAKARRILQAVVEKGSLGQGRGAIYLAADTVSSTFSGNAFDVDGNDHDQYGALVPGGVVEAGIATRNDGATSSIVGSLKDTQKDNVRGLGFSLSPLTPSVMATGGPSVSDLDRIIAEVVANNPGLVVNDPTTSFTGNTTFGTLDNPQITRLTAEDVKIKANGNSSGAGILIVDGSITINGNLDFVGWIIVRGDTVINDSVSDDETTVLGNATILGSLWTGDLVVKVGGSAIVDFCEYCLNLADGAGAGNGNVPRTMRVVSWQEVL